MLDEAYFEYIEEPDYPDGIEEHVKSGRDVLVLRTFSKIYGLAGLRVGYGVGPKEAVDAIKKVRNAFDITQPGQDAAVASLADTARSSRAGVLSTPRLGPSSSSSASASASRWRPDLCELRLRGGRRGLAPSVRGAHARGRDRAPARALRRAGAIRVTVGTQEENELFARALRRVLTPADGQDLVARRSSWRASAAATDVRSRGRSASSRTATRSPTS